MTAPTPMEIAKSHDAEIRRLARDMSLQQIQMSRLLCGRRCRYNDRIYEIALVTFSSTGVVMIHGTLPRKTKKHPLGDLAAIELVT